MTKIRSKYTIPSRHDAGVRRLNTVPALTGRQHEALDGLQRWLEMCQSGNGGGARENTLFESFERDDQGNIVAIKGQGGDAYFAYDDRQRLIRSQRPGLADICCAYDEQGRLKEIRQAKKIKRFHYQNHGSRNEQVGKIERGNAGAVVFRYDERGDVIAARTPEIGLTFSRDANGAITHVCQTMRGVSVEAALERVFTADNRQGVLGTVSITGLPCPVRYEWDQRARPSRVLVGDQELVRYSYPSDTACVLTFANGWQETSFRQEDGSLPDRWELSREERALIGLRYRRDSQHRIVSDGDREYDYDDNGRLKFAGASGFTGDAMGAPVTEPGSYCRYRYDEYGNLSEIITQGGTEKFHYRCDGSLAKRECSKRPGEYWQSDEVGRISSIRSGSHWRCFHYDDADQLTAMQDSGGNALSLCSDAYDRTSLILSVQRQERFLYGPDDQLLAVYTPDGALLRSYVYGPNGRVLAEIKPVAGKWRVYPLHLDPYGNCRAVTCADGEILARMNYSSFGMPFCSGEPFTPIFQNHFWCCELGMFDFKARWYDPSAICFLTPDSYTGAPDDERLLHGPPNRLARVSMRAGVLGEWLQKPVVRLRYAFCWYDPLNHHDVNGHWPAGAVLLNIIGFIWTLPNTLLGLFFEITCIVGELLRLILWLFSGGHSLWEPLGFDAAASSRVHAWAIVFRGGWLGSFPGLMGLTFGNVFFVNGKWEENPELGGPGDVFPEKYQGEVALPRREAFYEHMLAHTWQSYAWGPLFYWIPPPGIYLWSIIFSGKCDSFLEKDAIETAGL